MKTLKQLISASFEWLTGRIIISPQNVGLKFEQIQIAKLFQALQFDCVFDVGANEGQYARMLRSEVGYTGPIVSFEPVPAAAERLRREAAKEGNWYVEEMALDKREGLATLNVMKEDQFSSLLTPSDFGPDIFGDKNTVSKRVSVKTSTLAVQLARYRKKLGFKMAFLKMDTQGNDLAVAIGAGASLREFAGLQSELAIKLLYKNAPSFVESLDYYRTNGFELSAFVPNNTGHFPYLIEIDCIMLRADVIVELASRLA